MPQLSSPPKALVSLLSKGKQRNEVFDAIPEGAERVLEIGYGDGCLLMRLMHQKNCSECYGMEINPSEVIGPYLEENWQIDLTKEELPEKYKGFFNWVILHDVLEHIYNPWKFLGIINQYVAKGGRVVIVCPNAQYWEVPYALLTGNWPLGKHGFWNEDHVRWFTFKTLNELAIMAGFGVETAFLQYPERVHEHKNEFEKVQKALGSSMLELPLLGFPAGHMEDGLPFVSPTAAGAESLKLVLPKSAGETFPYIMAIKIMLVCEKRGEPELFDLKTGQMTKQRHAFYERIGVDELKKRHPGNIQVQIIRG
jgi:SAM-dependent methyltransferase